MGGRILVVGVVCFHGNESEVSVGCRGRWEGLNLCSLQADSPLVLSVSAGLHQREGKDVEVIAELFHLEKEKRGRRWRRGWRENII